MSKLILSMVMSYSELNEWMTNLSLYARTCIPIIYLAIPGSNHSMSYSIRCNSPFSPNVAFLKCFVSLFTGQLFRNVSKKQSMNIYEQLRNGIRYFDLQICKKRKAREPIDGFYFCYDRYCDPIAWPLKSVKQYLEAHPNEFVILDFRQFHAMNAIDHDVVQNFLYDIFEDSIYGPRHGFLVDLTLKKAGMLRKQILLIYRDENCWENAWPDSCWPLICAKATHIEDLDGALEAKLKLRQPGIGCITQYRYATKQRCNASRSCDRLNLFARIKEWIPKQSAGFIALNVPKINILTSDFVELHDAAFAREVVKLNDFSLEAIELKDETFA